MSQEFQVVLLSGGGGNRMYALTEGVPKALLPVANRPLVSYQIEFLGRVGFRDIIVVLSGEDPNCADIKKYVGEISKGKVKVHFEIVKSNSKDRRLGTAEVLLKIKDKIKGDFIVMSGDLIVEEDFLHTLADTHRSRDAAVTVLLYKRPTPVVDETTKSKSLAQEPSDIIGLHHDGRILFFSATADLDTSISIPKTMLQKYPNITMHTDLNDSHFYIFSQWVLELLQQYEKDIQSLKGEFIPFLVRLQLKKKLNRGKIPEHVMNSITLSDEMSSIRPGESDLLGCYACILNENTFCTRVNTLRSYMLANYDITRGATSYVPVEKAGKGNFIGETSAVDPKTQIGPECIVGEYTVIGEKCSVKKSNIGSHCKIGNNVKIINSIIMDHVSILDKCTIQNSIVSTNVHVTEGCSLKDCQVGAGYQFDVKVDIKNESLRKDDDFMEN